MTPPTRRTPAPNLGPEIDEDFRQLQEQLTKARDLDWQEMRDHNGFWDQVGSAIKNAITNPVFYIPVVGPTGALVMGAFTANQAAGAAEDLLRSTEDSMWQKFDQAAALWRDKLRVSTGAALELADKASTWEDQRRTTFADVARQIGELEKQDHWKGESAEAYRKAIPSQRGATREFGQMIGGSSQLYDSAGAALTSTYTAVAASCARIRGLVSQQQAPTDPRHWARRMTAAAQALGGQLTPRLNDALHTLEQTGEKAYADQQRLKDVAYASPPFAKGQGRWPVAQGDTTSMAPPV